MNVIDWLDFNKDKIAVGVVCGLIGVIYGATKGSSITNKIWMRGARQEPMEVEHED